MVDKARHPKPSAAVLAKMRKAIAEEEQPEVIAANRETGRKLQVRKSSKEVQNVPTASQVVLASLLKEKEAQQVSLSDLEARTGIGRSNLSRLWNNQSPNVTLETVERIASALNCRIQITVESQK
ncbi:MAG: helix-turn-helix transcriptional regulator [Fuerstia sp.]|nr:helix-turn-helix transcriptional regulator [Fuerstiella sp.]